MGKGGDRGYPSHNKGFTEHTPDHVRIAHYKNQANHFERKAREVSEPPEQHKGRGRSADSHRSGRSHKSAHNMQKYKKKKGDDDYSFPDLSSTNYGMLALPSLYPEALELIADSYAKFYDMSDHMRTLTAYSYEAYSRDRNPNSFYVSRDRGTNKEKTLENYVAYVANDKTYLTMDHVQLKSEFAHAPDQVVGGIFYSRIVEYKQGDEDKEGFMSFYFPMIAISGPSEVISDSKFVSWVQAGRTGPALLADQMPKNVETFYYFFKDSLVATNIPMKGQNRATILEADIERLVKALRLIYTEPTRLMRTQGSYSVVDGTTANIFTRKVFNKTKENDPDKGHRLQLIVPYTSGKAGIAKKIIRIVMNKCLKKVTEESYLQSLDIQYQGIKHTNDSMIGRLWVSSAWILTTEICREYLKPERILSLTKTIFHDFSRVYEGDECWADAASWAAVKKDNGLVFPTKKLLFHHFAGSGDSAYKAAVPNGAEGDGKQAGGGAAAIGPPPAGGNDVKMGGQGTRIWDDSR